MPKLIAPFYDCFVCAHCYGPSDTSSNAIFKSEVDRFGETRISKSIYFAFIARFWTTENQALLLILVGRNP